MYNMHAYILSLCKKNIAYLCIRKTNWINAKLVKIHCTTARQLYISSYNIK